MINEDKLHRWFYIIVTVLLAVLAILKAILFALTINGVIFPAPLLR